MKVCLTICEKQGAVTSYVFDEPVITLGRAPGNHVLFDPEMYNFISRHHGQFYREDDRWYYADLGSKHGTYIGERRLDGPVELKHGDGIMIGPHGPTVGITWPLARVTGGDQTYLRWAARSTPTFPLAFSGDFLDRYAVYTRIGMGAFGEVWKGYPIDESAPVAIKLLNPKFLDPEYLPSLDREALIRRFSREARLQRLLAESGAPATVRVHSWGDDVDRDYLYIVMDLARGRSFDKIFMREPLMDPCRVARFLLPVARALHAAHTFEFEDDAGQPCRGIIHRDVKPGNIIADDESGDVRLVDFGVAGILEGGERLTMANITVGTFHFLPPESLAEQKIGVSTDLWGLAVTAYLALTTGRFPFEGRNKTDLIETINGERGTPLRAYRTDLPPRFEEALTAALRPDPKDRPQTAMDWIEVLGAVSEE